MKSQSSVPIKSIEELHTEMRIVKQRILAQEMALQERWQKVPVEAVKAVVVAILPGFIAKELVSGVWALIKKGIDLVKGKETEELTGTSWKSKLISAAKQLGLFTALKLLFRLWKGK